MATQAYFPFNFPSATTQSSNSLWLLSSTAIENFNINVFCEQDLDAKIVTAKYRKYGKLDAADRVTFSKCLIKFALSQDYNKIYKKEDFQRIAQLVVTIFPTEAVDTYFTPAQNGKQAKGKLWDSYKNLRSTLACVGFIERRSKKPRSDRTEGNEVFGL